MSTHVMASVIGVGVAVFVLFYLGILVLSLVAGGKVIGKAGYSPWFVLLGLIPLVNFVMFLIFAFSDWPVHQELRRWRQGYGAAPGPYGGGAGPYGGAPGPYGTAPGQYGGGAGPYGPPGGPPPPSGWQPPQGGS